MTATAGTAALRGFNVLMQAEDKAGMFFVAYGCAARDSDEACAMAEAELDGEGCWGVEVDEVWEPDDAAPQLPETPQILGCTGRNYVGDEDDDDI